MQQATDSREQGTGNRHAVTGNREQVCRTAERSRLQQGPGPVRMLILVSCPALDNIRLLVRLILLARTRAIMKQ